MPPLSTTEAFIRKEPPGPSIVPAKLDKEPFTKDPAKFTLIPAISESTETLPPIFRELGSILKEASVSIWALIFPWRGPAEKAPSPVIV